MVTMADHVAIRVPASSANLGPGFDALGMALSMYLDIGLASNGVPDGARLIDEHHPSSVAFAALGGTGALWVRSAIPMGRGLGFSGAARVGGLALAKIQRDGSAALASSREELLAPATELEGHPDNVGASLLGGVTASASGRVVRLPLAVDPLIVVWVPETQTSTDKSRIAIPGQIPLPDVIFNIGHTALLMAALAAGDVASLRAATVDRLHQDRRLAQVPGTKAALDAALDSPAWCAWLSGSGPTMAAMCAKTDAPAVAAVLPSGGAVHHLEIDTLGTRIIETT
jgi:homoserine kinase